ncbi:hypothetical protein DB347_14975 [Opitutaceae bacterium EW11]|nr:hypothetical protein DB347_14975 [Opitutaceae bacterium EW11]
MILPGGFRRIASIVLIAASACDCFGETLVTRDGKQISGTIGGVYGPLVLVTGKGTSRLVPVEQLDDTSLGRVAASRNQGAPSATDWAASNSPVAQALRGKLTQLNNGKLVDYTMPGPEPEFYLVYFSAHWCGPCRRFTPGLIEEYKKLKEGPAAARFEMIFVSNDNDADEQRAYITSQSMPWPAVKYTALGRVRLLEKWAGPGIPCLVVVNREGDVLFHSYSGDTYLGPQAALDAFKSLLPLLDPNSAMTRRAWYRSARHDWLQVHRGGDVAPSAYFVSLDRQKYPVARKVDLTVTVEVDAEGHVVDVVPSDDGLSEFSSHLRRDARDWLFLPAVHGGQPVAGRATILLQL